MARSRRWLFSLFTALLFHLYGAGLATAQRTLRVDPESATTWSLSTEPSVSIGERGGPDYELYRVADALFLADGGIVVVNGGSNELRFFDDRGQFLKSYGGSGRGPGEFQALSGAHAVSPDTIVAWDFGLRRASLFSIERGFERTIRLDPAVQGARLEGVTTAGELLIVDWRYGGAGQGEVGRLDEHRFLYAITGERIDSLGSSPGMLGVMTASGSGMEMRASLFRTSTTYGVGGDWLWIETGGAYRVELWSLKGDGQTFIEWDGPSLAVSRAYVDAEIQRQLLPIADAERRRRRRIDLESRPVPASIPATSRVLAGRNGQGWIEIFNRPDRRQNTEWLVIDPESGLLARVLTTPNTRLLDIADGRVLVLERDEFDVEYVRVYDVVVGN